MPVRALLTAISLAFLALSAVRYHALRAEHRTQTEQLEEIGFPLDPRVGRELLREPEIDGVRLRAARAVLAGEMAHIATLTANTPEEREEMLAASRRLAATAAQGAEGLAARPGSWEAALVLGAATYLSRSLARDSTLFTSAADWEGPLLAARRLGPAKREPARFLAAAYLEIWPALSPPKRAATRELLSRMFLDPEDRRLLLIPWLTAVDRREAFPVLPPDPETWQQVQSFYAGRGDWPAFSEARQRWDHVLWKHLSAQLAAADARLARGDVRGARLLYLEVAEQTRPDTRYRDLLEGALTRCPAGPVGAQTAERLTPRLTWVVERCLLAECPLPPAALKRLAHLAGTQAPPQEALALLLAGDLRQAHNLEKRSETLWSEEWAPYLVAKARAMTEARRLAEARSALDLVHLSWWNRPAYQLARFDLARATGRPAEAAQAADKLRGFARRDWSALDWAWSGGKARLELLVEPKAHGIDLGFAEVPAAGTVVELRVDGATVGTFPVFPGRPLRLALPLRAGFHVLDVEGIGGGRVLPGALRLR